MDTIRDFFQYVVSAGGHDWTNGFGFRHAVRLYNVAQDSWYFKRKHHFLQTISIRICYDFRTVATDMPRAVDRGQMITVGSRLVVYLSSYFEHLSNLICGYLH